MRTFLCALLSLQVGVLHAEAGSAVRDSGFMQSMIMLAIAVLFFYFILLRPEQKRRKALEGLRTSLKKGDRVTAMGIVGTVLKIQEETVILAMVDNSKIEVLKGAITDIAPSATSQEEPVAAKAE